MNIITLTNIESEDKKGIQKHLLKLFFFVRNL